MRVIIVILQYEPVRSVRVCAAVAGKQQPLQQVVLEGVARCRRRRGETFSEIRMFWEGRKSNDSTIPREKTTRGHADSHDGHDLAVGRLEGRGAGRSAPSPGRADGGAALPGQRGILLVTPPAR